MRDMPGTGRPFVCLVADHDALDRFPGPLRFLLVGLADEPVDVVLVAPRTRRTATLAAGPTQVILREDRAWPFSHAEDRRVIRAVAEQAAQGRGEGQVIVHALTVSAAPLAGAIADAVDGDFVITLSSLRALRHPSLPRLANRAWTLVTATEAIAAAIAEQGLLSRAPRMIPFGIPCSGRTASFADPSRIPVLVFAGPIDAPADGAAFLHAAKRIASTHGDVSLFIMGKGPAEDDLRETADSLGLRERVTFTGRLDTWSVAFDYADIFCLPGPGEDVREEPLAALAAGAAVLAPLRHPYDGLIDGQTAFLLPRNDAECLALRLKHCLDDPGHTRTVAAAGQDWVRQHLSLNRMVSEYASLYREAAARHRTVPLSENRQGAADNLAAADRDPSAT